MLKKIEKIKEIGTIFKVRTIDGQKFMVQKNEKIDINNLSNLFLSLEGDNLKIVIKQT